MIVARGSRRARRRQVRERLGVARDTRDAFGASQRVRLARRVAERRVASAAEFHGLFAVGREEDGVAPRARVKRSAPVADVRRMAGLALARSDARVDRDR